MLIERAANKLTVTSKKRVKGSKCCINDEFQNVIAIMEVYVVLLKSGEVRHRRSELAMQPWRPSHECRARIIIDSRGRSSSTSTQRQLST